MLRAVAVLAALLGHVAASGAVIWVEGERPAKAAVTRHPWYSAVKAGELSGREFASHWDARRAGELEYAVEAPKAGRYDLFVRANPVQAKLSVSVNGGDFREIDLQKDVTGNTNVAADGKPDLRFVAWVKAGPVELRRGPNAVRFRMHSPNSNHGMLDCFALADEPFEPKGTRKPGEAAAPAEAEDGWLTFDPPADPFTGEALLDLRSMNEKVAGEGGFIEAREGQFVHSRTGRPVRFWAVNGPPHSLKDPAALRRCARMLAKRGVNLVRVHGGIYDRNGALKPEEVTWRLAVVEAMKAEGIYVHLSIYFPLWLTPAPGTKHLLGYDGQKHPFAALYFNEDFQGVYRGWCRALLTTPSPTTGKRLVDDPAVFGFELINEDSYFFWTFDAKNIPDEQLRILETKFAAWAAKKHGGVERALAAWKGQKAARDDVAGGRLGFRPLWNIFNEKSARDRDAAAFLLESQKAFYEEHARFVRSLGFKGLVTASNWTTASAEVFGPLERYSYTVTDFIDRHGYFGCFHKGDNAAWSIRDGHTYADRSALRFDPEQPGKGKEFSHPAMDIEYDRRPTMISETTFTRPNRYRSEAPLYYAAYGALQESDAVVHFALDSAAWEVKPGYFMQPWTLVSPAMMGQFPAAAVLYRKGLVAPGEVLADLDLSMKDLLELKGTPLPEGVNLDELRAADVPSGAAVQLRPGQRIDPLVHYAGRARVRFTPEGGPAKLADLSKLIDRKGQVVSSSHGQLRLDYGKGVLRIDAPGAQGASGNLRSAGPTQLKDLTIASDLELGHVIAVSLDEKPIATSGRVLLQVMTEEKAAGFATEDAGNGARRIASIGKDPWLMRPASGTVAFKRADAASLKVTPLDANGYAIKGAKALKAGGIELMPGTVYYLVTR